MWDDPYRRHQERSGFDVMMVCENGHQLETMLTQAPYQNQTAFCSRCGAATLSKCRNCQAAIRGYEHVPGVLSMIPVPVPRYCHNCGAPYPWQEAALENIQSLAVEGGLSLADQAELAAAMQDVVKETPRTESASLKVKRLLGSLGKDAGDLALKVISTVASEAAKKIIFPH